VGVQNVKDYCAGLITIPVTTVDIDGIQKSFASTPTQWMCTSTCPCPPTSMMATNGKPWFANYQNSTAKYLYKGANYSMEQFANIAFGRTTTVKAGYTGFTFALNSTNTSSYYTNFWDCYNYVSGLAAKTSSSNSQYANFTTVSTGLANFLKDLETTLDCNGICYPGLFYYFKTVLNPPPTQQCLDGITKILAGNPLGMGILLLISFFLTIVVHITTWSMCCKCCAPKEAKDNWENKD